MISTKLSRIKKHVVGKFYQVTDSVLDTDRFIRYKYHNNGYHNPNYSFNSNQIALIHLPKTAGTSFGNMLVNDKQNRFINLHIHKPISIHCNAKEFKYITILRDPTDRVWSYYQMVLRNPPSYPYHNYAKRGLTIFLNKCWAANNLACRYLTSEIYKAPNETTLINAFDNLKLFYCVIPFEEFSKTSYEFLLSHGISIDQITHERNVTYASPTQEEIDLINKHNKFDIALYNKWNKN